MLFRKRNSLLFVFLFILVKAFGQCPPQIFDQNNVATTEPLWQNCVVMASDPLDFEVSFRSPHDMTDYFIDFGDGSPVATGAFLAAGTVIKHTYLDLGAYNVIITCCSCPEATLGTVINERAPTAVIVGPEVGGNVGCAPHSISFRNDSYNVNERTTFTWEFGDGTVIDLDHTNAGQAVTHTYQREASDCGIVVKLTARNGCDSSITTWSPVNIYDIDTAIISPAYTLLCDPNQPVTFYNTSDLNCITGQRYEFWDMGDGTTYGWQEGLGSVTHTFPGPGIYSISMIDSNACGPDIAYALVEIVEPPVANLSANSPVCPGDTIDFTNLSTGYANRYSWNFGDGSPWKTVRNKNPEKWVYTTPGIYEVKLAAWTFGQADCKDTATITVEVLPGPVPGINKTIVGDDCGSQEVTYTDASTGATTWFWDFSNGVTSTDQNPPPQTYINAGKYYVSLEVTGNGCTAIIRDSVEIFPPSNVNSSFTFDGAPGCSPVTKTFTNTSTGATSYFWNFGDGTTSTDVNPTHTFVNNTNFNQTFIVSLIAYSADGCPDSSAQYLTVYPVPTFDFEPTSGCHPLTVQFKPTSGAVEYKWDFGDGSSSIEVQPEHTFFNTTNADVTYDVTLIANTASSCTDTITKQVLVKPGPQADFVMDPGSGCSALTVNFTNASSQATSYIWAFGDGDSSTTSDTNLSHVFRNSTSNNVNYTVTLTAKSLENCESSIQKVVTVFPGPVAGFASDTGGCGPYRANFFNYSQSATSYSWNFGDGTQSVAINPSHTFINSSTVPVTFNVQLVASAPGCSDTVTHPVSVYPSPVASITGIFEVCPMDTTELIASGGTDYYWNPGSYMNDTIRVAPGTTTTYTVTVKNDYNCIAVASESVTAHPLPNANAGPDQYICPGGFATLTASGGGTYEWNPGGFVNGTITVNPASTTTYTVTVTDANGCKDDDDVNVFLYPPANADAGPDITICEGESTNLTGSGGVTYLWTPDNLPNRTITVSPSPTGDYAYVVHIEDGNGCPDSDTVVVTVTPGPDALYSVAPAKVISMPENTFTFTNQSTTGTWNYFWDFGDGTYSSAQNPDPKVYNGYGKFPVKLIVSRNSGCSDTYIDTVQILPVPPIPDFEGSGQGCSPVTVAFQNTSQYGQTFFWNFGDGTTSTQKDPTHTYHEPGIYNVSLKVTNESGEETITKYNIVEVWQAASAFFVIRPDTLYLSEIKKYTIFDNYSTGSESYAWDFGDGNISVEHSPKHFYTDTGQYAVTLIANNTYGCSDTATGRAVILTKEKFGDIVIGNAFTPIPGGGNGGHRATAGLNDVFFPVARDVVEYNLKIFNRWGELLFESLDYDIGWDGYYRGQLCQPDVYVYKVVAKFKNGERKVFVGDVTLLR